MGAMRIRASLSRIAGRCVVLGAATLAAAGCAGRYSYSGAATYSSGGYSDGGYSGGAVEDSDGYVSVSYFWNDLAPYGRWVDYQSYGWCWVPESAPAWRPYSDGRWIYTDAGYCWASDVPWSWATEHYGRWEYDAFYGWIWVPGTVWAPAWVAWHCDDDWVGWAPLPPTAVWSVSVGLTYSDVERLPAESWCFVHSENIVDSHLQIRPAVMNERLLSRTRDVTRISVRGGRPVDDGPDVRLIERGGRVKMNRAAIVDVNAERQAQGGVGHGQVRVFRPAVREDALRQGPPPEVQQREQAQSPDDVRKQYGRRRQALEQALSRDRSALQNEHRNEMRNMPKESAEQIRQRQEQERQAFEQRAAEQRRQLEERQQRALSQAPAPQEHPTKQDRPGRGRHGHRGS